MVVFLNVAIKTLVGPSVPPMIENPIFTFLFHSSFLRILILEGVDKQGILWKISNDASKQMQEYKYGTEQGLAALIYGEKGVSLLPIQDIAGKHINTDNEYMYYYSV